MPPKKDNNKEKKTSGIKRSRPESNTLTSFFNAKEENKKIRTNSNEVREREKSKEPSVDAKKSAQDQMNLFNCNKKTITVPNAFADKKDIIAKQQVENSNIFNFQKVARLRGNQLIENSTELKILNEFQTEKLCSKYRTLSSNWIKTQLGLCLKGAQCFKEGKLFSSKFKPCRTNELLDMKNSDRIVSWLCGFVEKRRSKVRNKSDLNVSGDSDQYDETPKPKQNAEKNKGQLNFFGANIKDNKVNISDEQKNPFKKKSVENESKSEISSETPKSNQKRLRKNKQQSTENASENKQSAGVENLLFWESKQYNFDGLIYCGTAGQGKRTTISAICQSAKIEVENIDCGLYEKFSEIRDKFNNGIRHMDIKVNLNENKNNHLNVNNELEYSNVAENTHLNDKLKDLKQKKVFILNNFETLFKQQEINKWGNLIKSIMDFFDNSSYPFIISTNPKHAQILGDYLYDFDIIVGEEKDCEKIYALFYQILFCEKFVKNLGQDLKRDLDKQVLEQDKDQKLFLCDKVAEKLTGIDVSEEAQKINIDINLIEKFVAYFEGNLHALFSRTEQYKQAFFYNKTARKNLYDDLLLWRIDRMDLDEELVKNVLYYKSYQYNKNNKRKKIDQGEIENQNNSQNFQDIDLDIIKIDNICEYIKISDEVKEKSLNEPTYQIKIHEPLEEKKEVSTVTSSSCKNGFINDLKDVESSNSMIITEKKSRKKNYDTQNDELEKITVQKTENDVENKEILALQKQLLMLDNLSECDFMLANMEHLKEELLQSTQKLINPNKSQILEEYLLKRDWVYHNEFKSRLFEQVQYERPNQKFSIDELEFFSNCCEVDHVEKSRYVGYRRISRKSTHKKIIENFFEEKETIEMIKQIKKLKENVKTNNKDLETFDPSIEFPNQFEKIVIEESVNSDSQSEQSAEVDIEKDFWKII